MFKSIIRKRPARSASNALRLRVNEHLAHGQNAEALALMPKLRLLEPTEPRWPHMHGDLLRAGGRTTEAVRAYDEAAQLYADQGLLGRAAALNTLASNLVPARAPIQSLHPMVLSA